MGFRWSRVQIPPARPTRTHFRINKLAAIILTPRSGRSESNVASSSRNSNGSLLDSSTTYIALIAANSGGRRFGERRAVTTGGDEALRRSHSRTRLLRDPATKQLLQVVSPSRTERVTPDEKPRHTVWREEFAARRRSPRGQLSPARDYRMLSSAKKLVNAKISAVAFHSFQSFAMAG